MADQDLSEKEISSLQAYRQKGTISADRKVSEPGCRRPFPLLQCVCFRASALLRIHACRECFITVSLHRNSQLDNALCAADLTLMKQSP